jgi:hypothetical protein
MRRKLSIAFTVYNAARARARKSGDIKQEEILNKVLGNLVRDAHRANKRLSR